MISKQAGLLILCMAVILTGCAFKDIDKRFFVASIGIDQPKKLKKGYRVTLKLTIPPKQPTSPSSSSRLLTEEGDTVTDAVQRIESKVEKELDFGQTKAILLGERFAKKDLFSILDWLQRQRDIQKIAWMAVAKPDAKSVLGVKVPSEFTPATTLILPFSKSGTESQFIIPQKVYEFFRNDSEKGIDPILPVVETGEKSISINTINIFSNHVKKLELSKEETKIFNMIKNGLKIASVKITDGNNIYMVTADQANANYSLETSQSKAPRVKVNLNLSGLVEEQRAKQPITQKGLKRLEKIGSRQIKDQTHNLLVKLQKKKVDPIGFGLHYRATHWNNDTEWKQWQSLYPQLKFHVKVNFKLNSTGLTR